MRNLELNEVMQVSGGVDGQDGGCTPDPTQQGNNEPVNNTETVIE